MSLSLFERILKRHRQISVGGIGHRDYVGGLWDQIGELQCEFLLKHGLKPEHVLLDIACGSLRAGSKLIRYLGPRNYLGVDANRELMDAGIQKELGHTVMLTKRPEFIVSSTFEFDRFSKRPDFAIAHALFIHLSEEHITRCMQNVANVAKRETKFYATFLEANVPTKSELPHFPHVIYHHTRQQMLAFGKAVGFSANYIGEWGHPRRQVMVEYLGR